MIFEQRNPTYSEYCDLRNAVDWSMTGETSSTLALNNSLFSIVVMHDNNAIGMGRIIGDNGLYFYIQDIIVRPDFQSQHIATEIMIKLMHFIKTNAEKGSFVGLMATPGLEGFYNSFGFTICPEGGVGMSLFIK